MQLKFSSQNITQYQSIKTVFHFRRRKPTGSESPKVEKSPKNNPKPDEAEYEPKQLNGTIKQASDNANLDSNYNNMKEGCKNEYETPLKVPPEEIKEETKKVIHERR